MRIDVKRTIRVLAVLLLGVGAFFLYLDRAFPKVRCEGAHLSVPEKYADCVSCHAKSTARATQDWKESKHGAMLVKCVVCHGEPDGKGSISFSANPDPATICARCHDPAMRRMAAKFGGSADCSICHPRHQNPLHSDAYQHKTPSGKTSF
ncbi:MAG: hypothetical protein LBQ10_03035 [Desulfovibrio sp.]|jgi:hypothetical protein|nr:hypothetical protein [Desulfovibrio sp.]